MQNNPNINKKILNFCFLCLNDSHDSHKLKDDGNESKTNERNLFMKL